MKTELEKLNDHYDQSRANHLSGLDRDCPGQSHLEHYREKHPVKYKRLLELTKQEE
jgi:hypothetical protein